jgi:hypothetical protein
VSQASGENNSYTLPLAVSAAVSFCVVLSFLHFGIPSGHDFEFHFNSWIEVVNHWKEGVLYPHWAALAHYAYGEARFIFYPPISWIFGALLGLILPWKLVSAAYLWIALTLSGASMFALARRWFDRSDAILAAAVYAVNPYHLVIVFWRSDMAELLAASYLPLLLLYLLRAEEEGSRVTVPLALLLAAGWLTNVPTAIMMHYSIAVLALTLAVSKRLYGLLASVAVAILLGAALASVYLLPVFHQLHWINIGQVLAPGVQPEDSFLFTTTSDADHNRFNLLISIVAIWEIAILVASFFISRRMRNRTSWRLVLAWSMLCILLMFRFSLSMWSHLPELRYVQFPWRWLLCMNVCFGLITVMALRHAWLRVIVFGCVLASVLLVWRNVQTPWWDDGGDIQEMLDNQQDGVGNEGADEYVPADVDPYDADQNAPRVRFEGPGHADVQVIKWDAEFRSLRVKSSVPGALLLRLFNYPLWRADIDGRPAKTSTSSIAGQIVVAIPAGQSAIQIKFVEGWDRWAGAGISFAALLLCLLLRRRAPSGNLHPHN